MPSDSKLGADAMLAMFLMNEASLGLSELIVDKALISRFSHELGSFTMWIVKGFAQIIRVPTYKYISKLSTFVGHTWPSGTFHKSLIESSGVHVPKLRAARALFEQLSFHLIDVSLYT